MQSFTITYSFSFLVFLSCFLCDSLFIIPHFFAFVKPFLKFFQNFFCLKQMFCFSLRLVLSFAFSVIHSFSSPLSFQTPVWLYSNSFIISHLTPFVKPLCKSFFLKLSPKSQLYTLCQCASLSAVPSSLSCNLSSDSFIIISHPLPFVKTLMWQIMVRISC